MDNPEGPADGALVAQTGGDLATNAFRTGDSMIDAMPFGTQVWFNEALYEAVTRAAKMMAGARGFVSPHLVDKTETCFAVAMTALDAGLNPFMLAQGAYQTPDGKVGYETKAVQAIVEAKGFFSKPPKLAYSGPWDNLVGMHKKEQSPTTKKWSSKRTWTEREARGCKLQVTFYFTDMKDPVICEPMDLAEVGTHFSTGWALEPKNQFARLVIRRQLQLKRPSILAGVRCIEDLYDEEPVIKDITPPKDGNAGLDAFGSRKPTDVSETVVEEAGPEQAGEAETETSDVNETPAPEAEGKREAKPAQDSGVVLWVSPDEPARTMKDIPAAIYVLRRLIKEAATTALAKATFDNNMLIIAQLDKKSADGVEAILTRRFEQDGASETLI